jgi:hypothetical protein
VAALDLAGPIPFVEEQVLLDQLGFEGLQNGLGAVGRAAFRGANKHLALQWVADDRRRGGILLRGWQWS